MENGLSGCAADVYIYDWPTRVVTDRNSWLRTPYKVPRKLRCQGSRWFTRLGILVGVTYSKQCLKNNSKCFSLGRAAFLHLRKNVLYALAMRRLSPLSNAKPAALRAHDFQSDSPIEMCWHFASDCCTLYAANQRTGQATVL